MLLGAGHWLLLRSQAKVFVASAMAACCARATAEPEPLLDEAHCYAQPVLASLSMGDQVSSAACTQSAATVAAAVLAADKISAFLCANPYCAATRASW